MSRRGDYFGIKIKNAEIRLTFACTYIMIIKKNICSKINEERDYYG